MSRSQCAGLEESHTILLGGKVVQERSGREVSRGAEVNAHLVERILLVLLCWLEILSAIISITYLSVAHVIHNAGAYSAVLSS